ncbi:hypothetical protein EDD90_2714 [Streptomyces sp. Ag109_O5-1]|uniref:hypothetical protein n=1 Tax=Streptomyces sp. Ag109_O5-1 TaxID=1938851 RepID=UPI000F4D4A39|nr:hypothetical protein [Streptomyces sp. Ag109_O5-1]RPE39697.1 hypothetical protein EDD90_2714 [Streptomyces sp. Ag109_O5-1]
MTATIAAVLTLAWCTAVGLVLAGRQDRRDEQRTRMARARAMPADHLGDEHAVQIAEQIVYAAWQKSP